MLGLWKINHTLKIKGKRDACAPIFTAALFTRAERQKQPKCPSVDEWINNMRCLYINGMFFSLKKKRKLWCTPQTWLNLGDIMLREIRYKRTNFVWFHLCKGPRIVQFIEMGRDWWIPQAGSGLGVGVQADQCLMGTELPLGRCQSSAAGWCDGRTAV